MSETEVPRVSDRWKVAKEYAADVQGLIASPFADLPEAASLFLSLPENAGGSWLHALRQVIAVTPALGLTDPSIALAFTCSGLRQMGMDEAALGSFSREFREGMHQIDRSRRLGDDDKTTSIPGGPVWGGNTFDPYGKQATKTPVTVHAVLLLYAKDISSLNGLIAKAEHALSEAGVIVSHRVDIQVTEREHFGFADGVSQPILYGPAIVSGPGTESKWHRIPAGEVIIGQTNAHGDLAAGPIVAEVPEKPTMLGVGNAPPGYRDLGRNGSYLVIRELQQDVAGFWNHMDTEAAALGGGLTGEWLAERVVGRKIDGTGLLPETVLHPDSSVARTVNEFGYFNEDKDGLSCPLGSHVRRSNPRDGLARNQDEAHALVHSVNSHRILRCGRKFGPPPADPRQQDGVARGLLFMCLNTDIARQFEFVQETWLLNPGFATQADEVDPLMGPKGRMSIPACPFRHRPKIETFVKFAGGEYFFLPSLSAIDYLATL